MHKRIKALIRKMSEWQVGWGNLFVPVLLWSLEWAVSAWVYFQGGIFFLYMLLIKLPSLCNALEHVAAKQKETFMKDFSNFIDDAASIAISGMSFPNALENYLEDAPRHSQIRLELSRVSRLYNYGIAIEDSLIQLSARYQSGEILDFARQLDHAERFGSDMGETLRRASTWIGRQILHRQHYKRALSEKIMEHQILSRMPIAILALLRAVYPDYLAVLFTEHSGRMFMMAAAAILEATGWLFEKLMRRGDSGFS